ncbi:MAG: apolipoprotein N-acyltransferase [Candidatus Omnitrophica bacterium]|nr:apolipoprotein N-acyltransferase [Candidatus Omnitrophota bacterium]
MPRRLISWKTKWGQTLWGLTPFVCALLLVLSYPPFDLGWLAWGALIPWLFSIERCSPGQAFLQGYLIGLLFFGATIWWIGCVTVPGVILLVAYLALYFGVWGWLAQRTVPGLILAPGSVVFGLPAAWALLEYLRSVLLSGFGWNLLAHTQWRWLPLIQIADLTGVWGLSFLVVMVNVALYLAAKGAASARVGIGAALLLLVGVLTYGTLRLQQLDPNSSFNVRHGSSAFRVTVAQGNIPQRQKWDEAFAEAIWKRYEAVTAEAAKEHPDLILWPETSVPGFLEEPKVMGRLQGIVAGARTPFLVGAPTSDEEGLRTFNSALLLNPNGVVTGRYDKVHLVPFGEYVPPFLEWLRRFVLMGDFSAGNRYTVFQPPAVSRYPSASFSVLICFEDLFPGLARRFVREGAQWLVVITNDAWFERSAASIQHLQASVFRAVEERRWVVRSANTGWSGFVDPCGRRLDPPAQIPRFQPGVATAELRITPRPPTLYARWGDWFLLLCGIIVFLQWIRWKRWISL